MKRFLSLVTLALAMLCATAQQVSDHRVVLFDHGDLGSEFWRIPAIAVASDGTVIAIADKRNDSNADLPNIIDLAIRRSTDNGATWSPAEVILPSDDGGGYGDAALALHKPTGDLVVVCAHGKGLWDATADAPQRLAMIRSTDNGKTWSKPVDITNMLYDPEPAEGAVAAIAGFASSGAMLCTEDGTLMFVLVARPEGELWGPLHCYLCYSTDGGYTWKAAPRATDEYGDESKVVELADGSLLMSIRNRLKGSRKLSRSTDKGLTWTEPRITHQLVDPACNGDLIALSPEQLEAAGIQGYPQGLLLHSLANDPEKRQNCSVYASKDLGITWEKVATLAAGGSSYSVIALLPDGTIGAITEENSDKGGFSLVFSKFTIE